MSISSRAESAREGARRKDGRFGEQAHADPGQNVVGGSPAEALEATRPDDVCVSEVDEPWLEASTADDILAGNHDVAEMWLRERHSDEIDQRTEEAARDWCARAGLDLDSLDADDRAGVDDWIGEQDQGRILDQAIEADSPRILHAPLASGADLDPTGRCVSATRHGSQQARRDAVRAALAARGIEPVDERSLNELVDGGPDRWGPDTTLDVVWHGRVADVVPDRDPGSSTDVYLSGTRLLLADSRTGQGHDVDLGRRRVGIVQGRDAPIRTDEGWAAGQTAGDWSRYRTGAPKGDMAPLDVSTAHRPDPETARRSAGVAAVLSDHPVADQVLSATGIGAGRQDRADAIVAVLSADDLDEGTAHTMLSGLAEGASREQVSVALQSARADSPVQLLARMRGEDGPGWRRSAAEQLLGDADRR